MGNVRILPGRFGDPFTQPLRTADHRQRLLTPEHIATWRRHFAELVETGKQGWWRDWSDRGRPEDLVGATLRDIGIRDMAAAWMEWPCGWFVRFTNGRVVLVVFEDLHRGSGIAVRGVVEMRRSAVEAAGG